MDLTNNTFIFDSETEGMQYIKHLAGGKSGKTMGWYNGKDEPLDINYMYVDPATLKLGWTLWTKGQSETVWLSDPNDKVPAPTAEHKQSFSLWVYPKYVKDNQNFDHGSMLWQRDSKGEFKGFQEMMKQVAQELMNPQYATMLPVFEVKDAVSLWGGSTCMPVFEFKGFKTRPEGFVIPDLPQESGAVISPNNSPAAPDSPIVDDEIPF